MHTQDTISTTLQAPTDAIASIATCNIPTTAIDPPTGIDITPIDNLATAWSIPAPQDQSTDGAELAIIFESVYTYFHGRVDPNDIQALTFCLRHLFCCSAKLYQNILPDLTANTSQQTGQAVQERDVLTTFCIWDQLQAIESLFERIESLCHLLNTMIPTILQTLENTCRARIWLVPATKVQISQPAQEDNRQPQEHLTTTQEIALAQLHKRLRIWQQSNAQRLIFVRQFADLQTVTPTLTETDTAFDLLQRHTSAIFGKILPHFLSLAATDDETATILLLDLMQKADELQFYMRAQLEPLYLLFQQYV